MNIRYGILFLFLLLFIRAEAQQRYLSKRISLSVSNKKLADVLDTISSKGNFIFSYGGTTLDKDSLVSVSAREQSVAKVLDEIFQGKIEYRETGNYIILRSVALHFSIVPEQVNMNNRMSRISGYVVDEQTGRKVPDASVYEKRLLRTTLTDQEGHFTLRFRNENRSVVLTASKDAYRDTSMLFLSGLTVNEEGYVEPQTGEEDANVVSSFVERFGLSRFLISSRQRIQSLNLAGFMSNAPFQASLIPGLSSHGMMSAQIVNKGSLNLIGGYTAGVKGVEIAGVFNINKSDVDQVQVAGLLNSVGGSVRGFQVAGLMNSVLGSMTGFQVAGLANSIRNKTTGFQVAGVANRNRGDVSGFQAAGLSNLVSGNFSGMQVTALINRSSQQVKGMQIAGINVAKKELSGMQIGLFNYSGNMRGMQIGLINVTDTSSGYSLGLLNFSQRGYHKIALSTNDVLNTNLSLKVGNANLYTILSGGANISDRAKVYAGGLGFGHDFFAGHRLSLSTELMSSMLYLGTKPKDGINLLNRFQTNLQLRLAKGLALLAGPSYAVYFSNSTALPADGYKSRIEPEHARSFTGTTSGWLGWNAGIVLF